MYLPPARRTFGSKCAFSKSYCVFYNIHMVLLLLIILLLIFLDYSYSYCYSHSYCCSYSYSSFFYYSNWEPQEYPKSLNYFTGNIIRKLSSVVPENNIWKPYYKGPSSDSKISKFQASCQRQEIATLRLLTSTVC